MTKRLSLEDKVDFIRTTKSRYFTEHDLGYYRDPKKGPVDPEILNEARAIRKAADEARSAYHLNRDRQFYTKFSGAASLVHTVLGLLSYAAYRDVAAIKFTPVKSSDQIQQLPDNDPLAHYVNDAIAHQQPTDQIVITQTQSYTFDGHGKFVAHATPAINALPARESKMDAKKFNTEVPASLANDADGFKGLAEFLGGTAAVGLTVAFTFAVLAQKAAGVINKHYNQYKPKPESKKTVTEVASVQAAAQPALIVN